MLVPIELFGRESFPCESLFQPPPMVVAPKNDICRAHSILSVYSTYKSYCFHSSQLRSQNRKHSQPQNQRTNFTHRDRFATKGFFQRFPDVYKNPDASCFRGTFARTFWQTYFWGICMVRQSPHIPNSHSAFSGDGHQGFRDTCNKSLVERRKLESGGGL